MPLTDLDFRSLGYSNLRQLPIGLCGIHKLAFTTGLYVGLDDHGYAYRYCYASYQEAVRALEAWDGVGDPPGPWIKQKPGDREGPGAKGF